MTGDISSQYCSPAWRVHGHSLPRDRVPPSIPGSDPSRFPEAMLVHLSLSPAGGWAVTGPMQVTAEQGGSLAVSCSYEPGYELYPKYWCRPGFLWFCFTYIVQTNGSEVMVTQGRVSIGDNHAARSFTVMLGGVMLGDADWYSCGLRRSLWFNLWHNTEVTVSAGKAGLGAKQGCAMEPVTWVTALGTGLLQPGEHRGCQSRNKLLAGTDTGWRLPQCKFG